MRPAPPIPHGSACELLLWVGGRRRRARAEGSSMHPALRSGETVLYDPRAYSGSQARAGEVVVLVHPADLSFVMVKRIEAVLPDGAVDVRGDNPSASTDSRQFGPVPAACLRGRVTCRFLPAFALDRHARRPQSPP